VTNGIARWLIAGAALAAGDFAATRRLLGRAYTMCGRVRSGAQLGRTLGFPTANLPLQRRRAPLCGIFAVRVRAIDGRAPALDWAPAVASLGTRPQVGGVEPLLEVHLFDFSGDLYGRELEVEFVAKLRDEQKFASLPAMTEQMQRDAAAARRILTER
jgi:riboflavin kinase/FMN adenylyltransferase